MLESLGKIADEYNLKVQSHLSENQGEFDWVSELHPKVNGYANVYNSFDLLRPKNTIMAHCIYSDESEINLLKENDVFVSHKYKKDICKWK